MDILGLVLSENGRLMDVVGLVDTHTHIPISKCTHTTHYTHTIICASLLVANKRAPKIKQAFDF